MVEGQCTSTLLDILHVKGKKVKVSTFVERLLVRIAYCQRCSDMDHIFSCKQVTTPCLPLPCEHSPDGATTDCGRRHLIAVYYSFIDTVRMKGRVGLVG